MFGSAGRRENARGWRLHLLRCFPPAVALMVMGICAGESFWTAFPNIASVHLSGRMLAGGGVSVCPLLLSWDGHLQHLDDPRPHCWERVG